MLLKEAKEILEKNGYVISEMTKDEYDAAMEARNNRKSVAWNRSFKDPDYKKLWNRKTRELEQYPTDRDTIDRMRVPGKRPGTTRFVTTAERNAILKTNKEKNKEIWDRYSKLSDKMIDKLQQKYMKILEDEDVSVKEYEDNCHDWCIINWFSCPGSGYYPKIVQKGYKSKEEGAKDLAKFKEWAWTEVTYTDVESQGYALYPTEIIEEMGLEYKEKKVPQGKAPEFKANPYYRTNYWGD